MHDFMKKKMTKEQQIKCIDKIQKHQITRISKLQDETSELDGKINEMHNMIINLYERIVFLESHDHEHVNADMEPDKLDLSSHRVVN